MNSLTWADGGRAAVKPARERQRMWQCGGQRWVGLVVGLSVAFLQDTHNRMFFGGAHMILHWRLCPVFDWRASFASGAQPVHIRGQRL